MISPSIVSIIACAILCSLASESTRLSIFDDVSDVHAEWLCWVMLLSGSGLWLWFEYGSVKVTLDRSAKRAFYAGIAVACMQVIRSWAKVEWALVSQVSRRRRPRDLCSEFVMEDSDFRFFATQCSLRFDNRVSGVLSTFFQIQCPCSDRLFNRSRSSQVD